MLASSLVVANMRASVVLASKLAAVAIGRVVLVLRFSPPRLHVVRIPKLAKAQAVVAIVKLSLMQSEIALDKRG